MPDMSLTEYLEGVRDADEDARERVWPVICWDDLSPDVYMQRLVELDTWLAWLIATYHINNAVIPDCWPLHTDLREDLGHLWTAWRLTRHPEASTGSTGLEWDRHREIVLERCQRILKRAGCTSTSHKPEVSRTWTPDHQTYLVAAMADRHLGQAESRADTAAQETASHVLEWAEERTLHVDAARAMAFAAGETSTAAIARALNDLLPQAAQTAARLASRRRRAVLDQHRKAAAKAVLAECRRELANSVSNPGHTTEDRETLRAWRTSLDTARPAIEAIVDDSNSAAAPDTGSPDAADDY